jgi:outer membrane receptor protein involved in Fe transport
LVRLTAGQLDTRTIDFRRADKLGGGWYSKFALGLKDSGDFTISRNPDGSDGIPNTPDDLEAPEYSEFCMLVGETDCLLEERTLIREQDNEIRYGSLRLDKYLTDTSLLTFEGGMSGIGGPVFLTGIGRVQNVDSKRPFFRFNWSSKHWNVLGHYTSRTGEQVNLSKGLVVDYELDTDTQRYGFEAQGNWSFAGEKVRLVAGVAHTEERVDSARLGTGPQTVVYEPLDENRQAVFSQVDWTASRKIKLVFAGRVDASTLHETQFSPKAALVYSMTPKNSLRLTYNRAFQVANYSEFFLHTKISSFPIGGFVRTICGAPPPVLQEPVDCGIEGDFIPILAVGNNDLDLEHTEAWEVGYSGLLANKVFITVDYYNALNTGFITDLVPQVGTVLGNTDGCVDSAGNPTDDPTECPINNDYLAWVGPDEAENTNLFPTNLSVAQALRNAVDNSVGGNTLGFRLAQDLNGDPVVVGRTYTNVGEVETQGVDFGIQYFLARGISLQASYSWFDFEIIDSDERVRDILLPNTPEHKASLSFSFARGDWAVSVGGRWVQEFRWSAGVFQGDVPEYTTADLTASYRINKLMGVGLNVANFTDNIHYQAFGGDLLSRRALVNMAFTF